MQYFFGNLIKYREYIWYSAKAQLQSELANLSIGWLWWILEPTLYMVIYFFVYSVIFHQQTEYAIVVIIVGLQYWTFLQRCINASSGLIHRNHSIISKVYIPKFIIVISTMCVNAFKMLCEIIPIIAILIWYKIPITWNWIKIIPITLIFYIIVFVLCCWVMHIAVYIRDIERFLPIILRVMFYLSGVFYPVDKKLGNTVAKYMLTYNPFATEITDIRNSLLYGNECHWPALGIQLLIAVILGIIGIAVIKRMESQYIKMS